MNVTTAQHGAVTVITVNETRLTYPVLADFATTAADLIARKNIGFEMDVMLGGCNGFEHCGVGLRAIEQ